MIANKIAWSNSLEQNLHNPEATEMTLEEIQQRENRIKKLAKKIDQFIQSHEDLKKRFKQLTSIKGVGPKLTVAILTEMPDVKQFEHAKQYATFVGITPSHYQSGSSVGYPRFTCCSINI